MQIPKDQVENRAKRIGESIGQLEKAKSGNLTSAEKLKILRTRPLKTDKQFATSIKASQTRAVVYKKTSAGFRTRV